MGEPRRDSVAQVIRRDPLLIAAVAWTIIGTGLLFIFHGEPNAQVKTFWIVQVPLDVLFGYSSWQVARLATGAIRRFWRVLTIAAVLFIIGDTSQVIVALFSDGQTSTAGGTVQSTCFGIGLFLIVGFMLAHPNPQRSKRERLAFWLDSATVLVGGAVVAWCVTSDPTNVSSENLVPIVIVGAVILTAAFASVKLILSGNAPMHKAAAFPMIASAVVNGVGFFSAGNETTAVLPAYVFAVRMLPSLLIAAGPRIQEIIAGFDQSAFGSRRRKRYSLLPYGSIAIGFASMIVVLRDGLTGELIRVWGVLVGLGVIVALVAARQLVAFHDNTRLIHELDETLADLREHETRLRHQAHYDGLTELANRTYFHEQLAEALTPDRPGTVSLLLIDLDGFKAVNDTLGHAAGDALLAGVADHLRASVGPDDLVARLGGDEFAVLLRDCEPAGAQGTAQRILETMETPIVIGGDGVRAHASIGVASADGDDAESLLRAADVAMYAAKHHGKNCWRTYEPAMELA